MGTLHDLIEEAKVRGVWWALCIFSISYFVSHTSKSIWANIPVSVLILCTLRYLSHKVELFWKKRPISRPSYLSHIQKKQTTIKYHTSTSLPSSTSWKEKVNSPPVEAAIRNFVNKLLQDFVVDLWYSSLTPDKEALALIRALILNAVGAIFVSIREINLELLIRDAVELVSDHLDLFRRNQSVIGLEVIHNLSLEQIDEKLKYHLLASDELHPALVSSECEYKVLQRLVGGVLATVLDLREAQSPLVQCFSRELLTCLVLQPVMNLANPANINELIEVLSLALKDGDSNGQVTDSKEDRKNLPNVKPVDWERISDIATQRCDVLGPENVEDMWTKGRNNKENTGKLFSPRSVDMTSGAFGNRVETGPVKEIPTDSLHITVASEDKYVHSLTHVLNSSMESRGMAKTNLSDEGNKLDAEGGHSMYGWEIQNNKHVVRNNHLIKRSSSMTDLKLKNISSHLKVQKNNDTTSLGKNEEKFDHGELCNPYFLKQNEDSIMQQASQPLTYSEGSLHAPKLKCRVVGASYEKIGSKSFAVYYIAVSDAEKAPWFVKRRYRNFERLHRFLKDIPNYTLHLPPKRFLSSNIDDYFVHKRCILLDKYLQNLLSIANIAEQHEVWDFLSAFSKNYSYGKSTSAMKTLAVNVDDAMDDIVRQFKGVSDGLPCKMVRSPSLSCVSTLPNKEDNIMLAHTEKYMTRASATYIGTPQSLSDEDIHGEEGSAHAAGWHSDNELNLKNFPPRVVKPGSIPINLASLRRELSNASLDQDFVSNSLFISNLMEDQISVFSELSSPNVSVTLLNLVENIFQLEEGGWLRRQVFWMSKQILHLMMGDAIDDWLLRQIDWLRRDDAIAQGIHWVQDVLWPNGTFFTKLEGNQTKEIDSPNDQEVTRYQSCGTTDNVSISFEQRLEIARRASDAKKIILDGAPSALVNLVGRKQYRKCAEDIYHFLQSAICIKQLAYGVLELLLISVFPELLNLVQDIHQKSH